MIQVELFNSEHLFLFLNFDAGGHLQASWGGDHEVVGEALLVKRGRHQYYFDPWRHCV